MLYLVSESIQDFLEIIGELCVQMQRFPCAGVDELQLLGVEALPHKPLFGELCVAVHLVTQQGMTDVRHVCADLMRARMDEYVAICKALAEKHGCIFVNFQKLYEDFCKIKHSSIIAWDRVHPNQMGATLMAIEFLKHCGFDYSREIG